MMRLGDPVVEKFLKRLRARRQYPAGLGLVLFLISVDSLPPTLGRRRWEALSSTPLFLPLANQPGGRS